jgi:hypothetical protein
MVVIIFLKEELHGSILLLTAVALWQTLISYDMMHMW